MDNLDPYRAAMILIEKHGAQGAWRILTARAIDAHQAGRVSDRAITQQVLTALQTLTRGLNSDERRQ